MGKPCSRIISLVSPKCIHYIIMHCSCSSSTLYVWEQCGEFVISLEIEADRSWILSFHSQLWWEHYLVDCCKPEQKAKYDIWKENEYFIFTLRKRKYNTITTTTTTTAATPYEKTATTTAIHVWDENDSWFVKRE